MSAALTPAPTLIGSAELALHASNRAGAWMALLVVDADAAGHAASELALELELMADAPPVVIAEADSPVHLVEQIAGSNPTSELVLHGIDGFMDSDWQHLDLMRSRMRRRPAVVIVATAATLERLSERAPHLASWLVGVWRWDEHFDELSADEREQRLAALRDRAGWSDAELIERAMRGELPPDPEYAEWLVLLGRGELLPHE